MLSSSPPLSQLTLSSSYPIPLFLLLPSSSFFFLLLPSSSFFFLLLSSSSFFCLLLPSSSFFFLLLPSSSFFFPSDHLLVFLLLGEVLSTLFTQFPLLLLHPVHATTPPLLPIPTVPAHHMSLLPCTGPGGGQ